jgi:type IV secretion system protein VirB1
VRVFHYLSVLPFTVAVAGGISGTADQARASPLSTSVFESLAARCAPSVPPKTLRAVGLTESRLDPLALHDNTTGISEVAPSAKDALLDATAWIDRGDSVDIGLMQINSANLAALEMTPIEALNPCASLAGGAAVLQAAYGGGKTNAEDQVALLLALSRYNTGSPLKGIMNGYVHRVVMNAGDMPLAMARHPGPADLPSDLDVPPSWDISVIGTYSEIHGAAWLVPLAVSASVGGVPANKSTINSAPPAPVNDVPTDRPQINQ